MPKILEGVKAFWTKLPWSSKFWVVLHQVFDNLPGGVLSSPLTNPVCIYVLELCHVKVEQMTQVYELSHVKVEQINLELSHV